MPESDRSSPGDHPDPRSYRLDDMSITLRDAFDAKNGSSQGWLRLDERLRPWMRQQLAKKRLPDGHTADDIVNMAFADVFRDFGSFLMEAGSSFRKWISTIMLNRLADLQRRDMAIKRKAFGAVPIDSEDDSSSGARVEPPDDKSAWASMMARYNEVCTDFVGVLSQLDEESRRIIELRIFEERNYEEIAHILGVRGTSSIRLKFFRAMKPVRAKLARHMPSSG